MDELSEYRTRIGLFAYTAYKKSAYGRKPKHCQRKSRTVTKQTSKCRTTTEVAVETKTNHCTLALVLLLVSVACSIERYCYLSDMSLVNWLTVNDTFVLEHSRSYQQDLQSVLSASINVVFSPKCSVPEYKQNYFSLPQIHAEFFTFNYALLNSRAITSPVVSEEPVSTVNPYDNNTVLIYSDITSPVSEKTVHTVNPYDNNTVLIYSDITSPVSEESVRIVNPCNNNAVLNHRVITSLVRDKPVHTANPCDNNTLLNYRDIRASVSEEPVHTVKPYGNNTIPSYRDETSPVSEELVCTVKSCDNNAVLNYNDITASVSGEPVHTVISCNNRTGLFYRDITSPLTEEPVRTVNLCNNYTVLKYRNITSPVSEEPLCTINSVSETCSYLLGNNGCHSYNGNPGESAGEARVTPNTLRLIKAHIDESVGFIKTTTSHGPASATGFRVGDCYLMTAYHVFRLKIDDLLENLTLKLEKQIPKDNFQELCRRLEVKTEKDNTESFAMAVKRVLRRFLKDKATNTSLLLQRLEGLINTGQSILEFENNMNCDVYFTNNRQYKVDWKVEFGDEYSDIIIVKLLAEAGQTLPRALLLDENFIEHGDIHVIRYEHDDTPTLTIDQNTHEFKDDSELQQSVKTAVQWLKTKFPHEPENYFSGSYKKCVKCYDEETGHVILRASTSFTHGASGSPIVYSFNSTGQPIVGMVLQRGHPEFYYRAQKPHSQENRRFGTIQDDGKTCLFEEGTTMKKAAQLLIKHKRYELKQNIFNLSTNSETHVVNLDDLNKLLQTTLREEFGRLRADQYQERETLYSWENSARIQHNMPSVDMDLYVKTWKEKDRLCYITPGIKAVVQKISIDEVCFHCVVGVPASGKSTAIRHAALHLKDSLGFRIYVITKPDEFCTYLDKDIKQVFLLDDVIGAYSVDKEMLRLWDKYNDRIKSCLDKNTKLLLSLNVQLYVDQELKGKKYIFSSEHNITNLNNKSFSLSDSEMKNMLCHYLRFYKVANSKDLIQKICPQRMSSSQSEFSTGQDFDKYFPALCKEFCENQFLRVDPKKHFSDTWPVLLNVFQQIQTNNKPQFCGLLLCGITDLKDEHFSPICKLNKPQHFNSIIESLELDPKKDLLKIREALQTLDGVYTHSGNSITFLHPNFQDMVTYLYADKYYIFIYATRDFITSRVRLFDKLSEDEQYVLVYGEECVDLLVSRMIQELESGDKEEVANFIVYNCNINNETLTSSLVKRLYDHRDVSITQEMTDRLFDVCVFAVCRYTRSHPHTDVTSCPQYLLLASLITKHDCSRQTVVWWGWWRYPIILSVYYGVLPVIKLLLTKPEVSLNVSDNFNRCVLHWAVVCCDNNIDITKYLLSLPNLNCLNHRDLACHTPYWYVVENLNVSNREKLKKLYEEKGAIM